LLPTQFVLSILSLSLLYKEQDIVLEKVYACSIQNGAGNMSLALLILQRSHGNHTSSRKEAKCNYEVKLLRGDCVSRGELRNNYDIHVRSV